MRPKMRELQELQISEIVKSGTVRLTSALIIIKNKRFSFPEKHECRIEITAPGWLFSVLHEEYDEPEEEGGHEDQGRLPAEQNQPHKVATEEGGTQKDPPKREAAASFKILVGSALKAGRVDSHLNTQVCLRDVRKDQGASPATPNKICKPTRREACFVKTKLLSILFFSDYLKFFGELKQSFLYKLHKVYCILETFI